MREWSELTNEERNEIQLAYAVMPEREADLFAAQIHETEAPSDGAATDEHCTREA